MQPNKKEFNFTLVSAHFGDIFWIENLVKRVQPLRGIREIVLVDQNRSSLSQRALRNLPGSPQVVSFPVDEDQVSHLGHDHGAALNALMKLRYNTGHLILLDSDCFPIQEDWLHNVSNILENHDAIVARDPYKHGLSHPCFMVLPIAALETVDFTEGLAEVGLDVGRLVGLQLHRSGHKVYWDLPKRGPFNKKRGHLYLNGALYHHGSASFVSSSKAILYRQVNKDKEDFFRKKIAKNDFSIKIKDRIYLKIIKLI